MRDLDRLSRTRSDTSENRVGSFALGFFGLLCAMAVGFVSALRPPVSNSVDYGYDERLGAQTPSPSGAKLASNCSDKGAAIVGAAAMDSLDELRAGATAARGGPPVNRKASDRGDRRPPCRVDVSWLVVGAAAPLPRIAVRRGIRQPLRGSRGRAHPDHGPQRQADRAHATSGNPNQLTSAPLSRSWRPCTLSAGSRTASSREPSPVRRLRPRSRSDRQSAGRPWS